MSRLAPLRGLVFGCSLLALAAGSPALAQTPAPAGAGLEALTPPPLTYTHRTLANGLNVYAMPDATAGTVTVQLWYDVGGKDDPEGRSGFAHQTVLGTVFGGSAKATPTQRLPAALIPGK